MADIKPLTETFRSATTSVERANVLGELALIADDTTNAALKRFLVAAAEASTDEADESLRIAALEMFRWLTFPNDRYRQRVIKWVLGRIDKAGRRSNERVYAITTCRLWIDKPRVRARLLRLVDDETEDEGLRSLALDCFSRYQPGEAPANVIETCERLRGNSALGRTAAYVLRRIR
ncbi:hypothetical protein [Fimbriiglobus ruber]|uniref:HEAT repeat domain-containing protein n=1 Tax=Fimbriiglobus ruber TaxID=1908690 RepID=A0A225E9K6_9BACT|nr:hypothetical protein [Fimbriiglobus ruber]OWK45107.1 hypothetical protein FRUB_01438 [Fimbriiglobus ruber]